MKPFSPLLTRGFLSVFIIRRRRALGRGRRRRLRLLLFGRGCAAADRNARTACDTSRAPASSSLGAIGSRAFRITAPAL